MVYYYHMKWSLTVEIGRIYTICAAGTCDRIDMSPGQIFGFVWFHHLVFHYFHFFSFYFTFRKCVFLFVGIGAPYKAAAAAVVVMVVVYKRTPTV